MLIIVRKCFTQSLFVKTMRRVKFVTVILVAFFLSNSIIQIHGDLEQQTKSINDGLYMSSQSQPPLVPSNNPLLMTGWSSNSSLLPNYEILEMDHHGNIYIAGYTSSSIQLGPHLYSGGGSFIAKMNYSGTWEYITYASGPYYRFNDIEITNSGEVFVTGRLTLGSGSQTHFGPNIQVPVSPCGNCPVTSNAFVAMIESDGNWSWARTVGSPNQDSGSGTKIIIDHSDNSIIVGINVCPTYLAYCTIQLTKLNESGFDFGYASIFSIFSSSIYNSISLNNFVIDSQGNFVIYGMSQTTNQLSCGGGQVGTQILFTPQSNNEIFLAKVNIFWNGWQGNNYAITNCQWLDFSQSQDVANKYIGALDLDINANDEIGILGFTNVHTTFSGHFFSPNGNGQATAFEDTYFFLKFYPNGTSFEFSINTSATSLQSSATQYGQFRHINYNSGKIIIKGTYGFGATMDLNLNNKSSNSSTIISSLTPYNQGTTSYQQFALIFNDNFTVHDFLDIHPTASYGSNVEPVLSPFGDLLITIGKQYSNGFFIHNSNQVWVSTNSHIMLVTLRIDERDFDSDGLNNEFDHCPDGEIGWNRTILSDVDLDGCKDSGLQNNGQGEDTDDDNDGVPDPSSLHPTHYGLADKCPSNFLNWTSTSLNDRDGDGCRDIDEDTDKDDDGVPNIIDSCPEGSMYWNYSGTQTYYDFDADGCADWPVSVTVTHTNPYLFFNYPEEDFDDDNDGFNDTIDNCPRNILVNWVSTNIIDYDLDGCEDSQEDQDDDNDGLFDNVDNCSKGDLNWLSNSSTDHDNDGCKDDSLEDQDDDNDGILDNVDLCSTGALSWDSNFNDYDSDGCRDFDEDYDDDNDGIFDVSDDCIEGDLIFISNPSTDHDGDGCKDSTEDDDDDNDGFLDYNDLCVNGIIGYIPNPQNDWDNDGCFDSSEDLDDDNDGILDSADQCSKGHLNWTSEPEIDYDGDGCQDILEDMDDDNDGVLDDYDDCNKGDLNWYSTSSTDYDSDGCSDSAEDLDDDNDGIFDTNDFCKLGEKYWSSDNLFTDYDTDGCKDSTEDLDDDNDNVVDEIDDCSKGDLTWTSSSTTDFDLDGCQDILEDLDDDNDGLFDELDNCSKGDLDWLSNLETDHDTDGCQDISEDLDDDNDGLFDEMDNCSKGDLDWLSNLETDHDTDGCQDSTEDLDDDNDGIVDSEDGCSKGNLEWLSDLTNDYDLDGCEDDSEDLDDDNDGIDDLNDYCNMGQLGWQSYNLTDNDGDGCLDSVEDDDNDNDGIVNQLDDCSSGEHNWISRSSTDLDSDGCQDASEDLDDDNDGIEDEFDLCPQGALGWISSSYLDYDGDGCQDSSEDQDDDNDGVLDAIELEEGSDPLNANSVPAESFSVIIGNIELSTWDLIGIILGTLTSGFLAFAFFTRERRYDKLIVDIDELTHASLEKFEKRLELLSFFRLLSPRQSIKIESVVEKRKESIKKPRKKTPKIEKIGPETPAESLSGVVDQDGYEWIEHDDGTNWYRAANTKGAWSKWED